MEKKKLQSVSVAALIVSILPLAALAPSLLHFSLSAGIRTAWAGANTVFVLLGLTLSVVCVRSKESRSIINIASTAISVFWALLMVGIIALALFLTFVRWYVCGAGKAAALKILPHGPPKTWSERLIFAKNKL